MGVVSFIKKHLAVLVLCVALTAFFFPISFQWVRPQYINWLLGVIMLCMGMTLKPKDFVVVFSHPKNVIVGCIAQFTIMPILAWLLTKVFSLPMDIAIGVILVGCCPGGTASNVITYLAKGDLALSVGMTAVSTILAPVLTPLICLLLVGTVVNVNVFSMFLSIIQVVILPIIVGFGVQKLFPRFTETVSSFLPAISSIVIALIVGSVVSVNSVQLHNVGLIIVLVVILHNLFGFCLGYGIGRLMKMSHEQCVAVSIEVGMQNSGLSCALAQQHFPSLHSATVPGAIFSVWHNIAGSIVARIYMTRKSKEM